MRIGLRDLIEHPLSIVLFVVCALVVLFSVVAYRIERDTQPRGSAPHQRRIHGRVLRRDVSYRGVEWLVASAGSRYHLAGFPRNLDADAFPGDEVAIDALGRPADPAVPYERHLFAARRADWVGRVIEFRTVRPPLSGIGRAIRTMHATIAQVRDAMVALVSDTLPPPHDAVLLRLTIGYHARETEGIADRFRDAGVVHVLVVSGLHVGLVYALVDIVLRLLPISYFVRMVSGLLAVWLYALLVGLTPPVTRAAFMVSCLVAARMSERPYASLHALVFAATIILLENHRLLYAPSFQLSFAACLGLILFYPVLHQSVRPVLGTVHPFVRSVIDLLLATVAAQALTLPLVMVHFNRVSLAGLAANLFAVPMATLLLWCGVALYGALIMPFLTAPSAAVVQGVSTVFVGGMDFLGRLPYASVVVPTPAWWAVACYLAIALVVRWFLARERWTIAVGVGCIAIGVLLLGTNSRRICPSVSFLPIGLGDAVVIRAEDATACMIDCGADAWDAERVVAPFLLGCGVRELAAVVLTHAHVHHYGALEALSRVIPIRRLYVSDFAADAPGYRGMIRRLSQSGTMVTVVRRPMDRALGEVVLRLIPLWDDRSMDELAARDGNAVIALVRLRGASCLIAADVPIATAAEAAVRAGGVERMGRWDVVLLPRHGRVASDAQHPAFQKARVRVVSSDTPAAGVHRGFVFSTMDGVVTCEFGRETLSFRRRVDGWLLTLR